MEKKFAVIQSRRNADTFETFFDTLEEAMQFAATEWDRYLTPIEKKHLDSFAVCSCDVDEDGLILYTITDVHKEYIN